MQIPTPEQVRFQDLQFENRKLKEIIKIYEDADLIDRNEIKYECNKPSQCLINKQCDKCCWNVVDKEGIDRIPRFNPYEKKRKL